MAMLALLLVSSLAPLAAALPAPSLAADSSVQDLSTLDAKARASQSAAAASYPSNLPEPGRLTFQQLTPTGDDAQFGLRGDGYDLSLTLDGAAILVGQGGATGPRIIGISPVAGDAASISGDSIRPDLARGGTSDGVGNLFDRVVYHEVYPGIDLVYHSRQGPLEFDFEVAPGADPSIIAMQVAGAAMQIQPDGSMRLGAGTASVTLAAPLAYQTIAGQRIIVESAFVPQGPRQFAFALGPYDTTAPLVIDPAVGVPSGAIAWWRGEDNAVDSINGHHGTAAGDAGYDTGMVGRAFRFDGTGDKITVPHQDDISFDASEPFTIEFWAKTATSGTHHLLGKRDVCNDMNYQMAIDAGQLHVNPMAVSDPTTPGAWSHLAMTYSGTGSQMRIYADGVQIGSSSVTLGPTNSANLVLGASGACGAGLNGWIDEMTIYSRALSQSELQGIFDAGAAGKLERPAPIPAGLVGWWRGEDDADDETGAHDGSLVGDADFDNGLVGKAFRFSGAGNVSIPHHAALSFAGAEDFTVETWFKSEGPAGYYLLGKRGACAAMNYQMVIIGNSPTDVEFNPMVTPYAIETDTWYHLAGTYSAGVFRTYVNGTQIGSAAGTLGAEQVGVPLLLGSSGTCGNSLNGWLDEVAIYSRALSDSELLGIYEAGSAGKVERPAPIPAGLVAWWRGEGNAEDSTGAHDGTLGGDATYATGRVGDSFRFSGNGNVAVPHHAALSFNNQAFSVEAWFKSDLPYDYHILGKRTACAPTDMNYQLAVTQNATAGTDVHFNPASANSMISPDTWYHIASTYDGTTGHGYINGALVGTATGPLQNPNTAALLLGASGSCGADLDGWLDEVAIYSRALNGAEVRGIYEAGSLGKVDEYSIDSVLDEADLVTDGVCRTASGACTLRAALQEMAAGGPRAANFTLGTFGGGPYIVNLDASLGALPNLARADTALVGHTFGGVPQLTIRGPLNAGSAVIGSGLNITGSGARVNVSGVQMQQFQLNGIWIQSGAAGVTVRDTYVGTDGTARLQIDNYGIQVQGTDATIGPGVVAAGSGKGIYVFGGDRAIVTGSVIGTPTGDMALKNIHHGIWVQADGVRIIDNVVSGNGVPVAGTGLGSGIDLSGNNYVIQGNMVGTNAAGTSAIPNGKRGMALSGVGGLVRDNTVSGNLESGIAVLTGGPAIQGNRVGTNHAGTAPIPNGEWAILVEGSGAVIGGTAADGNLIAGNTADPGIMLMGNSNTVSNNTIGINITGVALPNSVGIYIDGVDDNIIRDNVISGNSQHGVVVSGSFAIAERNRIEGNRIGLSPDGYSARGNGLNGVSINGATGTKVLNNTVSGNGGSGIVLGSGSSGSTVQGNRVGVNVDGDGQAPGTVSWYRGGDLKDSIGNRHGSGSTSMTTIAPKVGAGQIVLDGDDDAVDLGPGFNLQSFTLEMWVNPAPAIQQVEFADIIDNNHDTSRNWVLQRLNDANASGDMYYFGAATTNPGPGVLAAGQPFLGFRLKPDVWQHVAITADETSRSVRAYVDGELVQTGDLRGTIIYSAQNLHVGRWGAGGRNWQGSLDELGLHSRALTEAEVQAIYERDTGGKALPLGNGGAGIDAINTQGNLIGGSDAWQGNVISGNLASGIRITNSLARLNTLAGNTIGLDGSETRLVANGGSGVLLQSAANNNTVGLLSSGNVIGGNLEDGVSMYDGWTNLVQGNLIGTNAVGGLNLGNGGHGIVAYSSPEPHLLDNVIVANSVTGGDPGVSLFASPRALLQGNHIGTTPSSTPGLANGGDGVDVNSGSDNVVIGGTDSGDGNVIVIREHAQDAAIGLYGGHFANIAGNTLGRAPNGDVHPGIWGIDVYGSSNATIGGTSAAAANTIVGFTSAGIHFGDAGANENTVVGNHIGTDQNGNAGLGNWDGVLVDGGAKDNRIGYDLPGAANIISNNSRFGIFVYGFGANRNIIEGNVALRNGAAGITIDGGNETQLGHNVIGGSGQTNCIGGITLQGAHRTNVYGNIVGFDATGAPATNNCYGMHLTDAKDSIIGHATNLTRRNIVGNNRDTGIYLQGSSDSTQVLRNLVGVNATGAQHGNGLSGIHVEGPDDVEVFGNIVAFNGLGPDCPGDGIAVSNADGGYVSSNWVGLRPDGSGSDGAGGDAGNGCAGIGTYWANDITVINNTVAGSDEAGIVVYGHFSGGVHLRGSDNEILGNRVGIDISGVPYANKGGIFVTDANGTIIGGDVDWTEPDHVGNTISGNDGIGVWLYNGTGNATVSGNRIGTNPAGTTAIPNGLSGISIQGTYQTMIGGIGDRGNLVSGNTGSGIHAGALGNLSAANPGLQIQGNAIGTTADGMSALPNGAAGILMQDSPSATVGGTGLGNLVSGNSGGGIDVAGADGADLVVASNWVGVDALGTPSLGNAQFGIRIDAPSVLVADNLVSGNVGPGILVLADDVVVLANFIGPPGLTGSFVASPQGPGVRVRGNRTRVEFNNITRNEGGDGIEVEQGNGSSFTENGIYDNGGLGIDIAPDGPNANDAGDVDVGPNGLQNAPAITNREDGYLLSIVSAPSQAFLVELYWSPVCDASGYGEGALWLLTKEVTTAADGSGSTLPFDPFPPLAGFLTATATDAAGNTSESSSCSDIASVPEPAPPPPPCSDGICRLETAGPLDVIFSGSLLRCQIVMDDVRQYYGVSTAPSSCGTSVGLGSTVYRGWAGTTDFTPVSGPAVSGSGTPAAPYTITAVMDAGASGLRVTQVESYVVGELSFRVDISVANTAAAAQTVGIWRAVDCYLGGSDSGFGFLDTANSTVACTQQANGAAGSVELFRALTPGAKLGQGNYYDAVYAKIQAGQQFDDTCQCNTQMDNGAGISWLSAIPAGGDQTFSLIQAFSAAGIGDIFDDIDDGDGDGVPNAQDVCPGHDDSLDADDDGTPDDCELNGPPRIEADLTRDDVSGGGFNSDTPVRIRFFDGEDLLGVVFVQTDAGGRFILPGATHPFDLVGGLDVLVNDTAIQRSLRLVHVSYDSLDHETNLASGTAAPNALVELSIPARGSFGKFTTANGGGAWTFDYGADDFDVNAGDVGLAHVREADRDSTSAEFRPKNQAPTFTPGADVEVLEDSPTLTILDWATDISAGPPHESGQTLEFVISQDEDLVPLVALDAATGDLSFTLAPNAYGVAVVEIHLRDSGGSADDGAEESAVHELTINILPVNDAPSFQGGPNQVVQDTAGFQSVPLWATLINPGPANENDQGLHFVAFPGDPSLFSFPPSIDPVTGRLSFAPAPGAEGTTPVVVYLQDDAGTDFGGQDASGPWTFTIQVDRIERTLNVTGAPSTVAAGIEFLVTADVRVDGIRDAQGTDVAFLAVDSGPGRLDGLTGAQAEAGVLQFSVSLDRVGTYELRASGFGLQSAFLTVTVLPGPAFEPRFLSVPSDVAAGGTFDVIVDLVDRGGNPASLSGTAVLDLVPLGGDGALAGNTASSNDRTAQGGWLFDVNIDAPGTYALQVAWLIDGPSGTATSRVITVQPADATRLLFGSLLSAITTDQSFDVPVIVADVNGNRVAGATHEVHLAILGGPEGREDLTVHAVDGRATFYGLRFLTPGAYTLEATGSPLASASAALDVQAGAPAILDFVTQPPADAGRQPFSVSVRVLDSAGNPVTSRLVRVTLSLAPWSDAGTLGGTVTRFTNAGVASFSDLRVEGTGYFWLAASSPDAGGVSSESFVQNPPGVEDVRSLHITPTTAEVVAGATRQFTAIARNATGATIPGIAIRLEVIAATSTDPSPSGYIDGQGLLRAFSPGVARVRATVGDHTQNATVTVVPGPLAQFVVTPTAAVTDSDGTLAFVAVGQDAFGNQVDVGLVSWTFDGANPTCPSPGSAGAPRCDLPEEVPYPIVRPSDGSHEVRAWNGAIETKAFVFVTSQVANAGETADLAASAETRSINGQDVTQYAVGVRQADAGSRLNIVTTNVDAAGNTVSDLLRNAAVDLDQSASDFALSIATSLADGNIPPELDGASLAGILDDLGTANQAALFLHVGATEGGEEVNSTRLNALLGTMTLSFEVPRSYFTSHDPPLDPGRVRLIEYSDGSVIQTSIFANLAGTTDSTNIYNATIDRFSTFAIVGASLRVVASSVATPGSGQSPAGGGGGGGGSGGVFDLLPGDDLLPKPATTLELMTGDATVPMIEVGVPEGRAISEIVRGQVFGAGSGPPANTPALPAGVQAARYMEVHLGGSAGSGTKPTIGFTVLLPASQVQESSHAVLMHLVNGVWVVEGGIPLTKEAGGYRGFMRSSCCSLFAIAFDTQPPTMSASLPSAAVSGLLRIPVEASDNLGIRRVTIESDGILLADDREAPYEPTFDTAVLGGGLHVLRVSAWDFANQNASVDVAITVLGPPKVVAVADNATDDVNATTGLPLDQVDEPADDGTPATVSFTMTPREPVAGESVIFVSTASDAEGEIVEWTWDFGDGTIAHGPDAVHVFEEGQFFLTLAVRDDQGEGSEHSVLLVIPAAAPPQEETTVANALPAWMFWLMPLLVSFILFALAYLVMAKGQPAIYNLVFFLFYTVSGLKSLSEAAIIILDGRLGLQDIAVGFNSIAAYVLIAIFLWFVLVFPRPVHRWLHDGRRGAVVLVLAVPFVAVDFFNVLDVGSSENLFNVYAAIVAAASLGLLWYHSIETDSNEERRRIRWLSITFLLLVVSAAGLAVLNILQNGAADAGHAGRAHTLAIVTGIMAVIVVPALEIVAAVILLYAILRYQVLGIDHMMMRITRGTIFALTVPSIFIVIGNSVEAVFEATVLSGVKASFIIAGFISALLMIPVQKWVTFMVHRFFPGFEQGEAEASSRRREIFEAQLRYSLLDGDLKPKEITVLRRLASSIGMTPAELRDVVKRFPGVEAKSLTPTGAVDAPAPATVVGKTA